MSDEVERFRVELWRARRRSDRRLLRQHARLRSVAERRDLRASERTRCRAIRTVLSERGLI